MIGRPSISSEVFAGDLRVMCASGEDTTEVGLKERLQSGHTCANLFWISDMTPLVPVVH